MAGFGRRINTLGFRYHNRIGRRHIAVQASDGDTRGSSKGVVGYGWEGLGFGWEAVGLGIGRGTRKAGLLHCHYYIT